MAALLIAVLAKRRTAVRNILKYQPEGRKELPNGNVEISSPIIVTSANLPYFYGLGYFQGPFVYLRPSTLTLSDVDGQLRYNRIFNMPGRISRAPRPSAATTISHKASAQALKSARSSQSARNLSPDADIPDEGEITTLRKHVSAIFADAQKSTTGHRKLVINLRKIQEACCYETSSHKNDQEEDFDEDDFNNEVVRCVLRVLGIKKSETVGDRIVRFLGVFLRVASDKGMIKRLRPSKTVSNKCRQPIGEPRS